MNDRGENAKERFRRLIDRRGADECWPWMGKVGDARGKASFWAGTKYVMARRFAYALSYGEPSADVSIQLTCSLRICMNHNHMYAKPRRNDLGNGTKLCSDCRRPKVYSEFSPLPSASDGYYNYCKACHRKRKRTEYKSDAPWVKRARPRKYGMTPDDLEAMLERQSGLCAICGTAGGKYGLGIDHDHLTGIVRELLCSSCNAGIAMFKDDANALREAALYVERWNGITRATAS